MIIIPLSHKDEFKINNPSYSFELNLPNTIDFNDLSYSNIICRNTFFI